MADGEEFCEDCCASIYSDEHYLECIVPAMAADGPPGYSAGIYELGYEGDG